MNPAFDSATLAGVVAELQALVGAKVQRVSQPEELQAVLSIFKPGVGEKHLLFDVSPRFYRAHLTGQRWRNPPSPPAFCAAARKHLEGARITGISQRDGDRILDIRLQGDNGDYLLSAELMGKHANLILVDGEGKILHALKLISSRQSRLREVLPGRPYVPPPAPKFAVSKTVDEPATPQNINEKLDEYFSAAQPQAEVDDKRRSLRGALTKIHAQKQLALSQLEKGTEESGRAAQYRRWGELLLGNPHEVKTQLAAGAAQVSVLDFYSEEAAQVMVPVDSELSPADNAERYFTRARHVEAKAGELRERAQRMRQEVEDLEGALARLETANEAAALHELVAAAAGNGWLRSENIAAPGAPQKPEFEGHRVKRLTSPDGYEILVGENATANDFLVRHGSHSNDWWLHLRSGTSAHAIIRTRNAPERVPTTTLLYAARQVAARSVAKHAGLAEVDYTLRKYVRKPRKAAPGTVTYSNQKTLRIEND